MIIDVKDAIRIARRFTTWDSDGPDGELGSFKPTQVTYNNRSNVWIVECEFRIKGQTHEAEIKIDKEKESIMGYLRKD